MSARSRTRAGWSPARRRFLAAAVAALLLVPHAAAADERDELDKTRRRLGAVESVLGNARAEATAVADALAAADVAVAVARARLAAATGELGVARRRRADALAALEAASGEVDRQEARLAWQVRRAYMTGGVSGLAVVVQASDLRDLMERAVTLPLTKRNKRSRSQLRPASPSPCLALLRQHLARTADLHRFGQADLDRIAAELNGRPRQTLGFHTPSQILAEALR